MKRARLRTTHTDPQTVAAALEPDNTDEMTTTADPATGIVDTRVHRDSLGGLHTTVDDYLRNLGVADRLATSRQTETHTTPSDTEDN